MHNIEHISIFDTQNPKCNDSPTNQVQNQCNLIDFLNNLTKQNDLLFIKNQLRELLTNNNALLSQTEYEKIYEDIHQIIDTKTLERTSYYLKRLIKVISNTKVNGINDLDLNKWKQYDDVITDSLWVLNKRDNTGAHNASYWGNYIPQIPQQLFKRFTKKGDWVLDPFLGSGTTLIECRRMGRNGIGVELSKNVVKLAESNISKEVNQYGVETKIVNANSISIDYVNLIQEIGIENVQFVILHPPYWDIIKFSDDKQDLSNAKNLNEFITLFGTLIDKINPILQPKRYMAVVIGDKYSNGEWVPLGFYLMNEVMKRSFKLKSIVVKNFEETKGKQNQRELWRYRALVGGFYIFKHEYIFLFQKGK